MSAQPDVPSEEHGEELIFTVRLGSEQLHDGLVAYLDANGVVLPFLAVMESLHIPIAGGSTPGVASGWFMEENQRFELDVNNRILSINGRLWDVDWNRVNYRDDDIYVDSEIIKTWLGIKFDVSVSELMVRIDAEQDIPLVDRLKRHRTWRKLQKAADGAGSSNEPPVEIPYRWLDWPTLDNTLRWRAARPQSGYEARTEYDVLASGDFLHMTGLFSANLASTTLDEQYATTRLQLRHSPTDPALPQVIVGDYSSPTVPLLLPGQEGVGLMAGTFREEGLQEFGEITIRGDVLNDWDVELYHNTELIAFLTVTENNQYRFDQVPLRYGLNLFRLVFYGPQGQRRERVERYFVGQEMIKPGQQRFRVAAQLPDQRLLPAQSGPGIETEGKSAEDTVALASHRAGLTENLSITTHALSAPLADGRHHYVSTQLQVGAADSLYDLTLVKDLRRGWATRIGTQTLGGSGTWLFQVDHFDDFDSPDINGPNEIDPWRDIINARWNAPSLALPITVQISAGLRDSGDRSTEESIRVSRRRKNLALTASLGLAQNTDEESTANTALLMDFHSNTWTINGQVKYGLQPVAALDSFNLSAFARLGKTVSLRGDVQYQFADTSEGTTRYGLSLSWRRARMTLSMGGGYVSDGTYFINLALFSSLQRINGDWFADGESKTNFGSAIARVYIDQNANQVFDAGDQPLPDVRLRGDASNVKGVTGNDGIAYLRNIPTESPVEVTLDEGTLGDPYWAPLRTRYRLQARPGTNGELNYPVFLSGEIEGTIHLMQAGAPRPASNVVIHLLSPEGVVQQETKTAFDGYYIFSRVLPGSYRVQVSPEQLQRLDLEAGEVKDVHIAGNGEITSGVDFTLRPLDPP